MNASDKKWKVKVPAMLKKHGVAATLTTYTDTAVAADGTVTQTSAVVSITVVPPYADDEQPTNPGSRRMTKTLLDGAVARPERGSVLAVNGDNWEVITTGAVWSGTRVAAWTVDLAELTA